MAIEAIKNCGGSGRDSRKSLATDPNPISLLLLSMDDKGIFNPPLPLEFGQPTTTLQRQRRNKYVDERSHRKQRSLLRSPDPYELRQAAKLSRGKQLVALFTDPGPRSCDNKREESSS